MRKFLLYPKENARVFEVNGREDADRLPWKDVVWEDVGFFRVIDFEALAKEYDGLHLTEEGNCRLHMSEFNPWDVESTVWFNVESVTPCLKAGGLQFGKAEVLTNDMRSPYSRLHRRVTDGTRFYGRTCPPHVHFSKRGDSFPASHSFPSSWMFIAPTRSSFER